MDPHNRANMGMPELVSVVVENEATKEQVCIIYDHLFDRTYLSMVADQCAVKHPVFLRIDPLGGFDPKLPPGHRILAMETGKR